MLKQVKQVFHNDSDNSLHKLDEKNDKTQNNN